VDAGAAGNGHLDGPAIWARVNEVDPVVREHTRQAEINRHLSKPVVDALRWAGVFRMAMPIAWGGPELDVCSQVEVIERLARADASAAWCAMIGVESGFFASYLDDSVARVRYPGLDMITAGFQGPAGALEPCCGGYRLSGQWSFGSGINHADVIVGGAFVMENGQPRSTRSGRPEHRIALLPTEQWEVFETWDPDGLAGTGAMTTGSRTHSCLRTIPSSPANVGAPNLCTRGSDCRPPAASGCRSARLPRRSTPR